LENETLRSDAESAGDGGNPEMDAGDNKSHFTADVDNAEMQAEDWEDELEEAVHGPIGQVKGWDELRKQIKADLKKNSKTLPLFVSKVFHGSLPARKLHDNGRSTKVSTWPDTSAHWLDIIKLSNSFLSRGVVEVQMRTHGFTMKLL
jgi:hypothetical protein